MKIAYLGPAGTFTEDALSEVEVGENIEPLRKPSIHDAILAVEEGEVDRAFVPIENSIEGSVRNTLDTLAFETKSVSILGEHDFAVHAALLAREPLKLDQITVVLSHPQPLSQCARFLREHLPGAELREAASTAEAARLVGESSEPWAAIGAVAAAKLYGCTVLREQIEDEGNNVTRFVWISRGRVEPGAVGLAPPDDEAWKTSLVFSELGDDRPGALVEALREFSSRNVNLTRIESRPLRLGLGRYMFFCDLEGAISETAVKGAVDALRGKAESVRILGSYPTR
ncbi:MAG TPA: prephenate dehydratase [Solirubrobacterales bacterium]|nr:prephenate dehydratase [Solirubrobacterales bacterium]